LLWNEYKNRLGQSVHTEMHFDLQGSQEDIGKVLWKMPSDKAPGPDDLMAFLSRSVVT
jgi:hypothetical protein